ncbi:hypothetical protein [Carp edema virus]|nr:hypothetical protein [Carp edema virus]
MFPEQFVQSLFIVIFIKHIYFDIFTIQPQTKLEESFYIKILESHLDIFSFNLTIDFHWIFKVQHQRIHFTSTSNTDCRSIFIQRNVEILSIIKCWFISIRKNLRVSFKSYSIPSISISISIIFPNPNNYIIIQTWIINPSFNTQIKFPKHFNYYFM